MGQRKKHRVQPLGYVNFTKVIFRPIKRLKLIRNWCPERSAKFYSTLSREAVGEDIGVPRGGQPAQHGGSACSRALNARFCGFAAQQRSRQNRYATQATQTAKESTVFLRIFAYSSTHEQSHKRSGTKLKQRARPEERTLFPISLLILRKKPTVLQSRFVRAQIFTISKLVPGVVNR